MNERSEVAIRITVDRQMPKEAGEDELTLLSAYLPELIKEMLAQGDGKGD